MDPVTMMLLMGGVQAISGMDKEKRQNTLAAAQTRYSPWTGIKAQPVEPSNPVGDIAQGGANGMAMQQNQTSAANQQKLVDAQVKAMNAYSGQMGGGQQSPMMGGGQQSPMMGGGYGQMSMSGGQNGSSPWSSLYNKPLGQTAY